MSAADEFKKMMELLNKVSEKVADNNIALYIENIKNMDEDELEYEFNSVMLSTANEFRWQLDMFGRKHVESSLIDAFEVKQYVKLGVIK